MPSFEKGVVKSTAPSVKKLKEDARRQVKFDITRNFEFMWKNLDADQKARLLTQFEELKGGDRTQFERDLIDIAVKRHPDAQQAKGLTAYRESVEQFPAKARGYEEPAVTMDFILNSAESILEDVKESKLKEAGRAYSKSHRRLVSAPIVEGPTVRTRDAVVILPRKFTESEITERQQKLAALLSQAEVETDPRKRGRLAVRIREIDLQLKKGGTGAMVVGESAPKAKAKKAWEKTSPMPDKIVGYRGGQPVFDIPASIITQRQLFGSQPQLWIYSPFGGRVIGTGGQRGAKRPNEQFVDVKTGELRLNPDYVKAEKEGRDTRGIPKTLYARSLQIWNRDKKFLKEAPRAEAGVSVVFDERTETYVPATERQIEDSRRTFYNRGARDRFYRAAAAIDPTQRLFSEARKRIRADFDLLKMPKGSKAEKAEYAAKVEALVPVMAASILAREMPRNRKELELFKLLSESLQSGEVLVPANVIAEADLSAASKLSKKLAKSTFASSKIREEPLRLKAIDNVDAKFRAMAKQIAAGNTSGPRYAAAMATLREREDEAVREEFNKLIREERIARAGVRRFKKGTELDGLGLLDFQNDMGGTITSLAVGGLIVYAIFKAITTKRA